MKRVRVAGSLPGRPVLRVRGAGERQAERDQQERMVKAHCCYFSTIFQYESFLITFPSRNSQ